MIFSNALKIFQTKRYCLGSKNMCNVNLLRHAEFIFVYTVLRLNLEGEGLKNCKKGKLNFVYQENLKILSLFQIVIFMVENFKKV